MAKRYSEKPKIPNIRRILHTKMVAARKATYAWMGDEAVRYTKLFQDSIRRQQYSSFILNPLTPKWLAKKHAAGADERVMIATGHYLSMIRVFITGSFKDDDASYRIGHGEHDVALDLDHQPTDMPLRAIAKIHERGSMSANIPARPHWRPFFGFMQTDMRVNRLPRLYRKLRKVLRDARVRNVYAPTFRPN